MSRMHNDITRDVLKLLKTFNDDESDKYFHYTEKPQPSEHTHLADLAHSHLSRVTFFSSVCAFFIACMCIFHFYAFTLLGARSWARPVLGAVFVFFYLTILSILTPPPPPSIQRQRERRNSKIAVRRDDIEKCN